MKAILTSLALLGAPLASPVGFAQSDGTLGSSSTGTLNFNVNISDANRVQIFGLGDMVQTIEAGGEILQSRGIGGRAVQDGNSTQTVKPICITADQPDTTVTLDWAVTPLVDGSNTVPFDFYIAKNSTAVSDIGSIIVDVDDVISLQNGSVTGVEARLASDNGGHGKRCLFSAQLPGRLTLAYQHLGRQTADTPGTYVSTVTLTVKPE